MTAKYTKPFSHAILMMILLSGIFLDTPDLLADSHMAPVAQRVLDELAAKGKTEFFIVLKQKGDIGGARLLQTKEEKAARIYHTLRRVALESQKGLAQWLDRQGVSYRQFWIVNQILVQGDEALLREVLKRDEVARIDANPYVRGIIDPIRNPDQSRISGDQAVEWGVQKVKADQVWNTFGTKGQGIVVAGQDTGVYWTHPALKRQYRGWNGSNADHNYNWHDAIHTAIGNPCGIDSPEPCDDDNHGTHTMGTMVGDDGGTNQIGVAPGAQWVACRNMDQGVGTPATYTECFEWFIAPYPIGGNPLLDGDPTKAPHIINNSWGCPPSEGCNQDSLEGIVEKTRAAGILVVISNGNNGSSCRSTLDPPAIYLPSFSIGATDINDGLASFSSRGPVTYQGKTYIKPNISAPGVNIRSSVVGGGYQSGWSGTSMAAPHVAGVGALLWSASPGLQGTIDRTEDLLEQTAVPRSYTTCGDPPGVPNNGYGFGIVDAFNAISNIPLPDVKANGADGPIQVAQKDLLTVSLRLAPNLQNGKSVDWWVVATTPLFPPNDLFFYHLTQGWIPGLSVTYQGPLFTLSPMEVLRMTGLPVGSYTFYFGVDTNPNGTLDMGAAFYDRVQVTVTP
ncbi:MAG: S8 family serine peptidase [Candidatus Tectomicrobia bacterium]|uniref:S8 family serine peptidase n=1 Tax=Tectimicrobiota bacterium TaxID=2528274 RepID=A0A932FW45_UNCTE|nr:S8 family serine peptidase [Candidatus Tectomicrobia bacterium]